jgi:hypothetical protein
MGRKRSSLRLLPVGPSTRSVTTSPSFCSLLEFLPAGVGSGSASLRRRSPARTRSAVASGSLPAPKYVLPLRDPPEVNDQTPQSLVPQLLWILVHSSCGKTLRPAPQPHKRTPVHALSIFSPSHDRLWTSQKPIKPYAVGERARRGGRLLRCDRSVAATRVSTVLRPPDRQAPSPY